MLSLDAIKQLSISLGVYRPARALHRLLTDQTDYKDHKRLLSLFIRPGDLAFDVGANIGEKTDIMLSLGARVVAFEPQPALAREVRARGSRHSLTVVQSAVGAKIGSAELFLTTSTGMASLRPDWDHSAARTTILASVTTLDAAIREYGKPVFCKIDVEGFEVDVLKGLSTTLSALSFEYHCHAAAIVRVRDCVARLTNLGRYEFQLTGTESGNFLLPEWLPPDVFLNAFPACASPHYYGDIFARLSS